MILRKEIKYIGATLTVVSFATVVWSCHATYTLPLCVTKPNIPIIYSGNTFLIEKQKINIFHINFQIATFLKTGVCIFRYVYTVQVVVFSEFKHNITCLLLLWQSLSQLVLLFLQPFDGHQPKWLAMIVFQVQIHQCFQTTSSPSISAKSVA